MAKLADYPFEVRPLTADEGSGYLVSYPDFASASLTARRSKRLLPTAVMP